MRNDAKDLQMIISRCEFTYHEAMWLIASIIAQTKLFHEFQNVTGDSSKTAKREAVSKSTLKSKTTKKKRERK